MSETNGEVNKEGAIASFMELAYANFRSISHLLEWATTYKFLIINYHKSFNKRPGRLLFKGADILRLLGHGALLNVPQKASFSVLLGGR